MLNRRESIRSGEIETSNASRRLYKVLILLNTITSSISGQKTLRSEWQKFLDGLSWLCDEKPGGKTVTSIAVSQTQERSIFWVACNDKANEERSGHLRDILQELRRVGDLSPPLLDSAATTIASKSIKRSFRRVTNYVGRLRAKLQETVSLCTVPEDIRLRICIEDMIQSCDQEGTCLTFYKFRYSQDFRRLVLNCDAQDASAQATWQSVRHLVGRLGSWHSATKVVLALATEIPVLVQNSTVRLVENYKPTVLDFELKGLTLSSVVKEALPDRNSDYAIQAMSAIFEKDDLDLGEKFQKCKDRSFNPKAHAEVIMADHFFSHQLEFWNGDRYIGCSKPSCFCCSLYMKNHAGMFIDRPCHGNIWINWCPTSPASADDVMAIVPKTTIINNMVEKIQSEMERLILSGLRLQRNQLESSTGISSGNSRTESTSDSIETSLRIWR